MHKMRSLLVVSVSALFVLCFFFPTGDSERGDEPVVRSSVRTLIVDINGSGNYTSIQEAINASSAGDIIRVWDGTYVENIVIDKSITVVGNSSGSTYIKNVFEEGYMMEWDDDGYIYDDGIHFQSIITIIGNGVTVSNLTVFSDGYDDYGFYSSYMGYDIASIIIINSSGCLIENCNASEYITGILSVNSKGNIIRNNTCYNCIPDGISCKISSNIVLENNTLRNNMGGGISIEKSHNIILRNNTIDDGSLLIDGEDVQDYIHSIDRSNLVDGKPIEYHYDEDSLIIPEDAGQVILVNCSGCKVEGLNLSSSSKDYVLSFPSKGIDLINSHGNTVANNACSRDYAGIHLLLSSGNTIVDNECYGDTYIGIHCEKSNGNHLARNYIGRPPNYSLMYGVLLIDSTNNVLKENVLDGASVAIENSNNTIFDGNKMLSGNFAVYRSHDCVITNNGFDLDTWGVSILQSHRSSIINNSYIRIGSRHYETTGIHISHSDFNQVQGNEFKDLVYGIKCGNSSYNDTLDNSLSFTTRGIQISGNNNRIENNALINCSGGAISISPLQYLPEVKCHNNSIISNACQNSSMGIAISRSENDVVKNNVCNNNRRGSSGNGVIYIEYSSHQTITFNTCSGNNESGLYLLNCNQSIVSNNDFNSNKGPYTTEPAHGIYMENCYGNKIDSNSCSWNEGSGIYLEESSYNSITNNTCFKNTHNGITLLTHSDSNYVFNNTCHNNTYGILSRMCEDNHIKGNDLRYNRDASYFEALSLDDLEGNIHFDQDESEKEEYSIGNSLFNLGFLFVVFILIILVIAYFKMQRKDDKSK